MEKNDQIHYQTWSCLNGPSYWLLSIQLAFLLAAQYSAGLPIGCSVFRKGVQSAWLLTGALNHSQFWQKPSEDSEPQDNPSHAIICPVKTPACDCILKLTSYKSSFWWRAGDERVPCQHTDRTPGKITWHLWKSTQLLTKDKGEKKTATH